MKALAAIVLSLLLVLTACSSDKKQDPWTEDEVTFVAEGDGTRVQLEHRHFERLGKDGGEKMRRDVEGGWAATISPQLRVQPAQRFQASVSTSYTHGRDVAQWKTMITRIGLTPQ